MGGWHLSGLIGGPGLGYGKDRFAAESLQLTNVAAYNEVKAKEPSKFLIFSPVNAIDGKKLAEAKDAKPRTPAQQAIVTADQAGDRKTLKADSFIPALMAVLYLAMLLYFKAIGVQPALENQRTKIDANDFSVTAAFGRGFGKAA